MYQVPEPPPLDHYISDISPTSQVDGILLHGTKILTDKNIAVQLTPIPRKLGDPVAIPRQLNSRYIENLTIKNKACHIDSNGRNPLVYQHLLSMIPKQKLNYKERIRDSTFTFPRSKRFERDYAAKRKEASHLKKCDTTENSEENVDYLIRVQAQDDETKLKALIFDPCCRALFSHEQLTEYLGKKHKETIQARRVAAMNDLRQQSYFGRNIKVPDEYLSPEPKMSSPAIDKREKADTEERRWRPVLSINAAPKNNEERSIAMARVSKSYQHELQTWYSKNVPVKRYSTALTPYKARKF